MILVIGYGNPLRSDDAVGQRIARNLEQRLTDEVVQILTVYQLTPELVEPIRYARLVIFVDARIGETPGMIFKEVVNPTSGAAAFTHHVTPGSLLGAARELYHTAPKGVLISITGAAFDYGCELSPQLNWMIPTLTDQVEEIIRAYSIVTV